MKFEISPFAAALMALAVALPTPAPAQTFSSEQKDEIGKIVREYLLKNPKVLREVMKELENVEAQDEADKHRAAVAEHEAIIFNSTHQVVLGNPQGDVTFVELFDYNCGFCKRAMTDMLDLLKADPKLKIVLKEFPVLGEGSTHAAQVAVAVRMQDKTGKKYLDFHQKMFNSRGAIDKARALAVAKEIGLDMKLLDKDMASEEVKTTLAESFKIAEAIGLNGTPSYVIGRDVVVGAVGLDTLRQKVNQARCGQATC
jgi:protein-disulfide isomerase